MENSNRLMLAFFLLLVALATLFHMMSYAGIDRLREQNEWMLRELLDQNRAMAADLRQIQGEE